MQPPPTPPPAPNNRSDSYAQQQQGVSISVVVGAVVGAAVFFAAVAALAVYLITRRRDAIKAAVDLTPAAGGGVATLGAEGPPPGPAFLAAASHTSGHVLPSQSRVLGGAGVVWVPGPAAAAAPYQGSRRGDVHPASRRM
jgi:hypothetical protein